MSGDPNISYLAGILDGEGCFSLQKSGGSYRTTIQVANNSRKLVDWLHEKFSGSISYRPAGDKWEENFIWILASKPKISELIPVVFPELKVKQVPAAILLEFCTAFSCGRGGTYTKEQYDQMDKYHKLMMLYNSKGPGSNQLKQRIVSLVEVKQDA